MFTLEAQRKLEAEAVNILYVWEEVRMFMVDLNVSNVSIVES